GRDFEALLGAQLGALAGHDLVDAEVVFERVHSGDVVVVVVLVAPDQTAALVVQALHRLEGHTRLNVLEAGLAGDADVEHGRGAVGRLGEDVAVAGRRGDVFDDAPDAPLAGAGAVGHPAGGDFAGL